MPMAGRPPALRPRDGAGPIARRASDGDRRRVSFPDADRVQLPESAAAEWVDPRDLDAAEFDAAFANVRSGCLLEAVIEDTEQEDRGTMVAEVIGQGIDDYTNLPLL